MPTLSENITRAIADIDGMRQAIIDMGVDVPAGTPISQYSGLIRQIGKGKLLGWKNKLRNLGENQKLNVLAIGDSGLSGFGASSLANSVVRRFYGKLTAAYGKGNYTVGSAQPAIWDYTYITYTPIQQWETRYAVGAGGMAYGANGKNGYLTYTFNGAGIGISYFAHYNGGRFTVSIDGGAAVEYNNYYNGTKPDAYMEITGLTDGQHTIKLTIIDDGIYFVLNGLTEISSSKKGISVHNMAISGTSSDMILRIGDVVPQNSTVATINPYMPDLTVISYYANDIFNEHRTPDVVVANLKSIINEIQYRAGNKDVILMAFGLIDSPDPFPQGYVLRNYTDAIAELAESENLPMLNITQDWSENFTLNNYQIREKTGWLGNDLLHASDSGHEEIARRLFEIATL